MFKWNIGWKWVDICFQIPFTKNVVSLETSQMFCIANHLTSFCLIRVLTKSCFWTESSKCVNIPKVFQALVSSDMNVNFWFCFPLWSITSGTSCLEHSLFICLSPKIYFEWEFSFKIFCVFSGYIEDLFTKKLCLRLPFLHRNLN